MPSKKPQKLGEIIQLPVKPRVPQPVRVVESQICPLCKGAGWLRYDVPYGHPNFGKAKKCQCTYVESARNALRYTYSWINIEEKVARTLESKTFASFHPNDNGRSVMRAYRKARECAVKLKNYLQEQSDQPLNVLLTGPNGTGKTHLACAILNELREEGIGSLYAAGNELFDAIYAKDFEDRHYVTDKAEETPLFYLDDLDKMQAREDGSYQKATLFTLFNRRYIAGRPVIISANEGEDWQKWIDRGVLSRILGDAEIIEVQGDDYRLKQRFGR